MGRIKFKFNKEKILIKFSKGQSVIYGGKITTILAIRPTDFGETDILGGRYVRGFSAGELEDIFRGDKAVIESINGISDGGHTVGGKKGYIASVQQLKSNENKNY